jgi:hypothetical protein
MKRLFLDANIQLSFHFQNAGKRQQKAIDLIFSEIEHHSYFRLSAGFTSAVLIV